MLPGIRGVSDVGPEYRNPYDIPLVFQDRLFDPNGNVCYDGNDHNGYLGNIALVNAKAYPHLKVERRKYRFRCLVGSNSRIWRFRLSDNSSFLRIAKDTWLFPKPQQTQCWLAGPATRADIVIDFAKYADLRVRVRFQGGREVEGVLKGYDKLDNLVSSTKSENFI